MTETNITMGETAVNALTVLIVLGVIVGVAVIAFFIYLFILIIRALRKYLKSSEVRAEKNKSENH